MKTSIFKAKQLPKQGVFQGGNFPPAEDANNLARDPAPEPTNTTTTTPPSSVSTNVYTVFDQTNDVITNSQQTITAALWSGNTGSLTTFFTSSVQTTSQRRYYVDIYDDEPSAEGSAVQFSVAYGNALGSGSSDLGVDNPASLAIYSQYRRLLLNSTTSRFTTAGSGSTDSIYVVNVKRNRVKERLDEGNFELALADISSRDSNATGSVVVGSTVHKLIDDSSIASATLGVSGRAYNIVSGSIDNGVYNSSAPVYYGKFYPDYGVMILDGNVLDQNLSFTTELGSDTEGSNHFALFHSISGSGSPFIGRNTQKITSANYFIRVKNGQYNYSNNPSSLTGSAGQVDTNLLGTNNTGKTYITTIGLYNENRELMAVAKLSKPLYKSFDTEHLIRVKLDY